MVYSILIYWLIGLIIEFNIKIQEPLSEICIDPDRKTLYTRSEQGSLQVFNLADQQVAKIAGLSANEIQYTAGRIVQ